MTGENFGELVKKEWEAREDHMAGEYSPEKRNRWVEARDELTSEFGEHTGGNNRED